MDRRDFLAATIGFLSCPVLSLEEEAEAASPKIIELPILRRSQPAWLGMSDNRCPHNFKEGNFYLAQDESKVTKFLGEEVKFQFLDFRERVERISRDHLNLPGTLSVRMGSDGIEYRRRHFVSYDEQSDEFKQIKAIAKMQMLNQDHEIARQVAPEQHGICLWGIEGILDIEGVEGQCRWMMVGRKGLAIVVGCPQKQWFLARIRKVKMGKRHMYTTEIHELDGRPADIYFGDRDRAFFV